MKKLTVISLSALTLSFSSVAVHADKITEGKMAFETCRGCHSVPSYTNAYPTYHVPKIGGQRSAYIVEALKAYRGQQRPHGTMKANTWNLDDITIENIAAYLEANKGSATSAPAKGDPEAGKKLAENCLSCHAAGKDGQANVPVLNGQYGSYLVKAIQDYQSGDRKNALMQSMVQTLSVEDVNNIAAYFASQTGLSAVE